MPSPHAPARTQAPPPPPPPALPAGTDGEGRDAAVVFATRLGVALASITSQCLLAYLLLPAGRGAYAVCVTFAYLLGMAMSGSGDIGAQYLAMSGRASVSKGLALGIGACCAGSLVAIALALPLIGSGVAFFAQAPASAFAISLALIPLSSCSFAAEMQVAGLRRFVALAVYLSMQSVVVALAVVAFVWWLDWGVEGGILALCLGHLALLASCLRDLRKSAGLELDLPSWRQVRNALDFGLRVHLSRLGGVLEPRVGILALAWLGSQGEVGMFAAVSAIMMHLHLIADSVSIALYPRVVTAGAGTVDMIGRGLRIAVVGTALALAVLLPVSEPLLGLLLSAAFVPAAPLLWIMAPGILAFAAAALFVSYFKGIERPSICSWATWAGLSANMLACVGLYAPLGMAAAAWGLTIGLAVRTACLMRAFHGHTGVSARELWTPTRADVAWLLGALRVGRGPAHLDQGPAP